MSIVANLAILGVFKYFGFFVSTLRDFASLFGLGLNTPTLEIILPVGISFFTFQSMSHAIDVYRGVIKAERNFVHFATFVAFFPQLVAGPIVRAKHFLPQLYDVHRFNTARLYWGLERFLIGLFKKIVIADNMAPLVDLVYADPERFGWSTVWLATLCYSIQIYADFAGYSDMAIGLARILGFKIPENFNAPYLSRTPSEFWQRWHISLSSWLKDYLYIPLGGNREGPIKTHRNLMLTMTLGGLWHGASYNFLLWGAFHGLLLVVYRPMQRVLGTYIKYDNAILKGLSILLLFLLVTTAWVPFRAHTLSDAFLILGKMYGMVGGGVEDVDFMGVDVNLIAVLGVLVAVASIAYVWKPDLLALARRSVVTRSVSLAVMIFLIFQYKYIGHMPFVYFQF